MAQVATDLTERTIVEFLESQPYVPIMQTPSWPAVKVGWDGRYVVERDEGGAVAGLSLLLSIADERRGGRFYYMPRGPLLRHRGGGVDGLAQEADYHTAYDLVACALDYARNHDGKLLRMDPAWVECDANVTLIERLAAAFPHTCLETRELHGCGQPRSEMILDLHGYDPDTWLAAIPARRRNYIRRAEREGVTTRVSDDPRLLDPLYELLVSTAKRQNITHRPRRYFAAMMDAYPRDYFYVASEHEGHIYSISLNLCCYGQVFNLYVGNDLSKPQLRASIANTTTVIREAFRRRCRYVGLTGVFGRDRSDSLYRYKVDFLPKGGDATVFVGTLDIEI